MLNGIRGLIYRLGMRPHAGSIFFSQAKAMRYAAKSSLLFFDEAHERTAPCVAASVSTVLSPNVLRGMSTGFSGFGARPVTSYELYRANSSAEKDPSGTPIESSTDWVSYDQYAYDTGDRITSLTDYTSFYKHKHSFWVSGGKCVYREDCVIFICSSCHIMAHYTRHSLKQAFKGNAELLIPTTVSYPDRGTRRA